MKLKRGEKRLNLNKITKNGTTYVLIGTSNLEPVKNYIRLNTEHNAILKSFIGWNMRLMRVFKIHRRSSHASLVYYYYYFNFINLKDYK